MQCIRISSFLLMAFVLAVTASAQMTIVNGASYQPRQPVAPGSFGTIFGNQLCGHTDRAEWVGPAQLPTKVGGCAVTVAGMPAMVHYVSPGQVNFIAPEGINGGMVNVMMHNNGFTQHGSMISGAAGPGVFSLSGDGMGDGAMLHGTLWQTGPFSATTGGEPTHVSIFMTGLDLSSPPVVSIGGVEAEVTFYGRAPGFAGLQQINVQLTPGMAGVGQVPVTVTSGGHVSNVTFADLLPTDAMMRGAPGWGPGMHIAENTRRGAAVSHLAYNPVDNTILVADENADVVRVLSPATGETLSTITLPNGSRAGAIEVSPEASVAAVSLRNLHSVALIDLAALNVMSVVGTGRQPADLTFAGDNLLVSNSASSTVSVISVSSLRLVAEIPVGFGPRGIGAGAGTAVVANMQEGSLSLIDLADLAETRVDLPAGARPMGVAVSAPLDKAVVTAPMSNGFFVVDLATQEVRFVATSAWDAMGPGAVTVHGPHAYIANVMTASVTVADLASATVLTTFPVDAGPRSVAVNASTNQLLVLSHGTGVIDIISLDGYSITNRVSGVATQNPGYWSLATVTSFTPNQATAGAAPFVLTVTGLNLDSVTGIELHGVGPGMGGMGPGGGMMGPGGGMGSPNPNNGDANILVSNLQVEPEGTRITATVEILQQASPGLRRIVLTTDEGIIMAPMFAAWLNVVQ